MQKLIITIRILFLLSATVFCFLLTGCDTFFDKDNTPKPAKLRDFCPQIFPRLLWTSYPNYGAGTEPVRLRPAVSCGQIFTASRDGYVTATNQFTGNRTWKVFTRIEIASGPAAADGIVVVGGHYGEVIALQQSTGCILWRNKLSSQILAAPAIGHGKVVIKSIDGIVSAFSCATGHLEWTYEIAEPTLILRGASAPVIVGNDVIIGFASGNLAKLSLNDGGLIWQQTVGIPSGCIPLQHMVDIDADPLFFGNRLYAATYQGRIASMHLSSGEIIWSHDISSYTGIAADSCAVYITDANGDVWAFNANNGNVLWRQTLLEYRNITGPAIFGNYLVVGDADGYLHWLCKQDGHLATRIKVNSAGIVASPVVNQGILYVVNKNGVLGAYR